MYGILLRRHGPQGWWPAGGSDTGRAYHPGDYSWPRNDRERFEICCGAILTQNTAWRNVETALRQLEPLAGWTPEALLQLPVAKLGTAIRPAGYFNIKTEKLRRFAAFYRQLAGRTPTRDELLAVWGIGPETADSIRLYAYGQVEMVADAYTRRLLAWLDLVPETATYDTVKGCCVSQLPPELVVYQEFHALVVACGKQYFSRRPYGDPGLYTALKVVKSAAVNRVDRRVSCE